MGREGSIAHADCLFDPDMLRDERSSSRSWGRCAVASRSSRRGPGGDERAALADDRIAGIIQGKTVRKVVVIPGRPVNIVAN